MTEPTYWIIVSGASLAGLGITAQASLRAWRGWLELRRYEIDSHRAETSPPSPASRIEIADLKERVRKLEAIAAGVDL